MQKKFDTLFSAIMLTAALAVVLVGGWCLSHSIDQAREAEPEPAIMAQVHIAQPDEAEPVPETPEPTFFDPSIPLSPALQEALHQACEEADVPLPLALGLIEVESCFDPYADNGQCYGLCQLNRDYFSDKLSPAENLREGIGYLGRLMEQHGDTGAALTAYNAGHDTGYRGYANAVLVAAGRWETAEWN